MRELVTGSICHTW